MAKVNFVKKARKDVPRTDIKAGESYYWWKFRFGGKHCSRTAPKKSQLTQSDFLSQLYDLQDKIAAISGIETKDDFDTIKEEILSDIETLKDETQEKLNAMPEHLQDTSSSGELLTERIEALDSWYSEIEGVECDYDEDELKEEKKNSSEKEEDQTEEQYDETIQAEVDEEISQIVNTAVEELQDADCGL